MGTKPVQRVMFQGDTKNVVLVFFYEDNTANAYAIPVRHNNAMVRALIGELSERKLPEQDSNLIAAALKGQKVSNHICDIA